MARRKRPEEHENHERWLVSYADFITLLFAFFVVMYSISSVNEGKYRVLSQTLNLAFEQPRRSPDPLQNGEPVQAGYRTVGISPNMSQIEGIANLGPGSEGAAGDEETLDQDEQRRLVSMAEEKRLGFIAGTLESVLSELVDEGLVDISHTAHFVEVNMKSQLLFDSGSARLSRAAIQALRKVAKILAPIPNPIQVEGYTDDRPIGTLAFPSNWELSAARAASVVHLFSRLAVDPGRMAAIGYAEHRPIADNATEEGRQKNRRVTLVILAGDAKRGTRELLDQQRTGAGA